MQQKKIAKVITALLYVEDTKQNAKSTIYYSIYHRVYIEYYKCKKWNVVSTVIPLFEGYFDWREEFSSIMFT